MKTLYLTDLDGTLLSSDAALSDFATKNLNAMIAEGMLFSYATARSYVSSGKVMAGININCPVANFNGGFITAADGNYIESCVLDKGKIVSLLDEIRFSGIGALIYAFVDGQERVSWIGGTENSGVSSYLNSRKGDRRLRMVDSYKELFEGEIFYISMIGGEAEMADINDRLSENSYISRNFQQDTYGDREYWLELYRHDASKAKALGKIKALVGAEKVVCFGDNLNDLPMFEAADECYAVSNAAEKLKERATAVIDSNDSDGVVKWLLGHI